MRLTFRKSFEFDTVLSSEKIFAGGQKFMLAIQVCKQKQAGLV